MRVLSAMLLTAASSMILAADKHVRVGDIRTTREVETDERDLARAVRNAADVKALIVNVRSQLRVCGAREQATHATYRVGSTGHEALREQLTSRDRTRMIGMKLRVVVRPAVSFNGHR